MHKFHLLMNGQNFFVNMDGKVAKYSFFQNFFIEAESPEQAESLTIQKIKEDEKLKAVIKNPEKDPPVIHLAELTQLERFGDSEAIESGKVWYREKKWWQFWR